MLGRQMNWKEDGVANQNIILAYILMNRWNLLENQSA
jgi:hypothetical protein